MIERLTDSEVAVIIDSLSVMREMVGRPAPNVESALEKINKMMSPSTQGLWLSDDHE